jgi:hypothetical protein
VAIEAGADLAGPDGGVGSGAFSARGGSAESTAAATSRGRSASPITASGRRHAEGLLQTQEELHALEAAEAEITIERRIERDAVGMRNPTKLPDEPLDDLENASLDLRGADPARPVSRRDRAR